MRAKKSTTATSAQLTFPFGVVMAATATDGNFEVKSAANVSLPFSLGTKHCRRLQNASLSELLASSNDDYPGHKHAVHCIIWSPWPDARVIYEKYPTKAAVLVMYRPPTCHKHIEEEMQVRFDGSLGFAGGLVDVLTDDIQLTTDDIVGALNRELSEEMNLNENKYRVLAGDHLFTDIDDAKKLFLHFFALNLSSEKQVREIERDALNSDEFDEVFGVTRVPLYTMDEGFRGLPIFLSNAFVGNSKEQLLSALKMLNILTDEEISAALQANRKFMEAQQHN